MEKKLDLILAKLEKFDIEINGIKSEVSGLKSEVNGIKSEVSGIKSDIDGIKLEVKGIKEEHGAMLKALLDNKEYRNAKMDSLDNNVAVITGVLTGFNNSLEPLRKLKKVK